MLIFQIFSGVNIQCEKADMLENLKAASSLPYLNRLGLGFNAISINNTSTKIELSKTYISSCC